MTHLDAQMLTVMAGLTRAMIYRSSRLSGWMAMEMVMEIISLKELSWSTYSLTMPLSGMILTEMDMETIDMVQKVTNSPMTLFDGKILTTTE